MSRRRALIVENAISTRELIASFLERLGYHTLLLDSGESAQQACCESPPDIVITDVCAVDANGLRIAEWNCELPVAPVIVMSSYDAPALLQRARDVHVFAYLIKPIAEGDLQSAMNSSLARFEEFRLLRKEAESDCCALTDRSIVEQAKALLMTRGQLTESEAFLRLQQLALETGRRVAQAAELTLMADDVLFT